MLMIEKVEYPEQGSSCLISQVCHSYEGGAEGAHNDKTELTPAGLMLFLTLCSLKVIRPSIGGNVTY